MRLERFHQILNIFLGDPGSVGSAAGRKTNGGTRTTTMAGRMEVQTVAVTVGSSYWLSCQHSHCQSSVKPTPQPPYKIFAF